MNRSASGPDVSVSIAGILLPNPTVLASGILGVSASSAIRVVEHGAGAVTLKSCGLEPRKGHPCPAVIPWGHGLLNAIGLSNPGASAMAAEIREFRERCAAPVFASIFGRTVAQFGEVAEIVAEAAPHLIEVNVSCPNVESELGTPFGLDPAATERITALVKSRVGKIPVSMKLGAGFPQIGRLARVCQEAGADAITAINTVGPGMVIDTAVLRPVLANRTGGLSGPAILPIAVRCVYEIRRECSLPIIGTGGVVTAEDALQMIAAGADAVGIGSGVYYGGMGVFRDVAEGLDGELRRRGLGSLAAVRGAAHAQ